MDGYEAASGRGELVVSVGGDGVPLGVRLSPAVMDLPAEELASRIVRLNTLAHLRFQLAIDQRVRSDAETVRPSVSGASRGIRADHRFLTGLPLWTMTACMAAPVAARIGRIRAVVDDLQRRSPRYGCPVSSAGGEVVVWSIGMAG